MSILRNKLPSAHALFVFEAAARLCSFKKAADELCVTQPTVTYAIKKLESHFGIKLFNRHHRGVELTGEGTRLFQDVHRAFGIVEDSIEAISKSRRHHKVSIAVSTTFANYWLLPRIGDFKQCHPGIDISFQTVSRDIDPQKEGVDLTIRRDARGLESNHCWPFADEEIFPVCSPGYLQKSNRPLRRISDLPEHTLLHWNELHRQRMGWREWLECMGHAEIGAPSSDMFNDNQLLMQAVIDGQGVALGWRHIVEPLIRRGWLVKPIDIELRTDNVFYLVAAADTPVSPEAENLRIWLLQQSKDFRSGD